MPAAAMPPAVSATFQSAPLLAIADKATSAGEYAGGALAAIGPGTHAHCDPTYAQRP